MCSGNGCHWWITHRLRYRNRSQVRYSSGAGPGCARDARWRPPKAPHSSRAGHSPFLHCPCPLFENAQRLLCSRLELCPLLSITALSFQHHLHPFLHSAMYLLCFRSPLFTRSHIFDTKKDYCLLPVCCRAVRSPLPLFCSFIRYCAFFFCVMFLGAS